MNIKYLFALIALFISFNQSILNGAVFSTSRELSSVAIDYNSGRILSFYNHNERVYPASLTKLMTIYIVFDHLKNGSLSLKDKIKISPKAASMPRTRLGIPANSYITVKDAILAIIVKSSNDIAYAIAEHISPDKTAQGFVDLMNEKVQQLGLTNTRFANPTGLHYKDQYTTALDIALLSRYLMIHHNEYYHFFSVSSFQWDRQKFVSTNHLLDYNGIDGIKTGYTNASGFNLVTSANKNNTRIIAVTIGFPSTLSRDDYMKNIIDESFEIAQKTRIGEFIAYKKPDSILQNDNNNTYLASYQGENPAPQGEFVEFENHSNYNISKNNFVYSIKNIDDNYITDYNIKPYYKGSALKNYPYGSTKSSKKFVIQLGAYHNKNAAINASYKLPKISLSGVKLTASNAKIYKHRDNYVVRFYNLTKNQAYNACSKLKQNGQDCFVLYIK